MCWFKGRSTLEKVITTKQNNNDTNIGLFLYQEGLYPDEFIIEYSAAMFSVKMNDDAPYKIVPCKGSIQYNHCWPYPNSDYWYQGITTPVLRKGLGSFMKHET